ncbi:MAG: T9SS type A sorting domain-containing protein [Chlorobi bacterium]|nr:T9SS type A sorting domain-containing protein [Chlorobiota bacterium]
MRKFNLIIALTFLLFIIDVQNVIAQWQKIILPEINIPISTSSIAAKGDTLFVGTYRNTIYRSTDRGIKWSKSDSGISNIYWTMDFLIDENTIYATGEHGIYRSTNMGETWELKNNGLHRGNWMNVYSMVKLGNQLFAATDFGVYKSSSNGENWYPSNGDSSYWSIYSLAVLNGSLFAGSAEEGMFRSTDEGLSWTSINEGIPISRPLKLYVDGENIYAGTNKYGIYYSSNNGDMWYPDTLGLKKNWNGMYYPIYSIVKIDNYLYAGTQDDGVYRNFGATGFWTKDTSNFLENSYVLSLVGLENKIFAATYTGLYSSLTGDINWVPVFTEFPKTVENINHIGSSLNNLFITTSTSSYNNDVNSIFYTSNLGDTWKRDTVLSNVFFKGIKIYGDSLYAFGDGLYYSSTDEIEWFEIDSSGINTFIKNNDTLYIGGGYYNWLFNSGQIYYSANNGESWTEIWNNDNTVFAIEKIGNTLFAGTLYGIFRSTNTGISWSQINNGLPMESGDQIYVWSLNTINNNIIVNTDKGIYLSTDYGNNWQSINYGIPIDTLGNNSSYLLTYCNKLIVGINHEIYISENLGKKWSLISNIPLGNNQTIKELAVVDTALVVSTSNELWKYSLSEIANLSNDNIIVEKYFLSQNYPNPFNPSTIIQYSIPMNEFVTLKVYDVLGRKVKTLVNKEQSAGVYNVEFNASKLTSGVYFYRIEAGSFVAVKKLLLLK